MEVNKTDNFIYLKGELKEQLRPHIHTQNIVLKANSKEKLLRKAVAECMKLNEYKSTFLLYSPLS